MRIEDLIVERAGDELERSVRLAWVAGETRLLVRVPAELALPGDDMSPFVPIALQLAMRRGEPLQVDGPVSARLLEGTTEAQAALSAWGPTFTRVPVRAREAAAAAPPAAGRACCFSRGVDSMWSATLPRRPGDEITHLVYVDGFDPAFTERSSRARIEAARVAAHQLGLPLVLVRTNVAEVLHGVVDFEDGFGAGLALCGLSLAQGIGRFLIPSSRSYHHLLPSGSHPLLDPRWSTERVSVEHDSLALERIERVRWLVEHRPDVLPHLHVCFGEDSAANCGVCAKCTWATTLLHVAGGLEASPFPSGVDIERVRALHFPALVVQLGLAYAHSAIPDVPEHAELRRAIADSMAASARKPVVGGPHAITRRQSRLFRAAVAGRPLPGLAAGPHMPEAEIGPLDPSWPPPRDQPPGRLGLLAGVDGEARSHVYAVDAVPPGSFIGELGAVLEREPDGGRSLRLDQRGRPALARGSGRRAALRWVLAPLRFEGPLAPRLRALARRTLDASRHTPSEDGAAPVAWLHAEDGDGRLALWGAAHPVLADVLLTTDPEEPRRLGYGVPELLGYVEELAPMTGTLGIERPVLPWTDGWSQSPDGRPARANRRS